MNDNLKDTLLKQITVILIVCSMSFCTASVNQSNNQTIDNLVKGGTNSLDAACAVRTFVDHCEIIYSKK